MFSVMSENHLDDTVRIMETVGGSNYGNMLLVPGPTGFMQVLHHGFTHSAELGGPMEIVAVHGNLSEAALKVIPKDTIVMQAGNNTGRRSSVECPTMDSILGTKTAEEFCSLAPAKNGILKQKTNHIFIGPDTFFLTKGAKQIRSSELAALIIDKFTIEARTTMTRSSKPNLTKPEQPNCCSRSCGLPNATSSLQWTSRNREKAMSLTVSTGP